MSNLVDYSFRQDTHETPVIFRKLTPRYGGYVLALFPTIPWSTADECASYAHVGQHGAADPYHVIKHSDPAKPADYAQLKQELEGCPFGYKLKIYGRMQHGFDHTRRAGLARLRGGK